MDTPRDALPPDPHERIGTVLRSKWRLDALLGVGGSASVYSATHRNGTRVAIKILHPELSARHELRDRFVREAYLANAVGHPAVVRVLDDDVDPNSGCAFLVMDHVEGTTLEECTTETPFGAAELMAVAEQALAVLVVAHRQGIVHQDLKPANMLVDQEGRLRLLDFGIARMVGETLARAPTLRPVGTPDFMAPEQVREQSSIIGPASDLYALGATLYALATGTPPHVAATVPQLVLKIATERAASVHMHAPELPIEVVTLIDRAIEPDPDDRWTSAEEMLAVLRRCRELLGMPGSALALACRHGKTLPEPPSTGGTDSVAAFALPATRPTRPTGRVETMHAATAGRPSAALRPTSARSGGRALTLGALAVAIGALGVAVGVVVAVRATHGMSSAPVRGAAAATLIVPAPEHVPVPVPVHDAPNKLAPPLGVAAKPAPTASVAPSATATKPTTKPSRKAVPVVDVIPAVPATTPATFAEGYKEAPY